MPALRQPEEVSVRERQQREQLRAMRHLRPGTALLHLESPLAQSLFEALLRLSDEHDPLSWLQQEGASDAALLTLSLTLDLAIELHHTARQLPPYGLFGEDAERVVGEVRAEQMALFGELPLIPEHEFALVPQTASLERAKGPALLESFARLQAQCHLAPEVAPERSVREPDRQSLLADLLRLPEALNPLEWLQRERSRLCAQEALAYCLDQVSPLQIFRQEQPRTLLSFSPKRHFRLKQLSGQISRVDLFENGFAIHLTARIYAQDAWHRRQQPLRPLEENRSPSEPELSPVSPLAWWEGFERITDNEGYHYLSQVADYEISNQLWWWRERLTLLCYPAPGKAQELILQSEPAALAMYRIGALSRTLIPVPGPTLGPLTVVLRLPRSQTTS
ncbi:hypothetical protein [Thermogemmatispora sp.]|uniref:hypothetical protein n=1 Tax=Thermogemmatispora sp. TaxID=1968838 RepID=UPI0035E41959